MYCIITGASRGIGRELAYIFAKHKYNLILTCKNNIDILNEIKKDIEKLYDVIVYTKKGSIDENDIKLINDDIYILINNQSEAEYGLLQDITKNRYDELIDSNITNAIWTTKYVLPNFIKNKMGIIVNISSVWGIYGSSNEVIYSTTKAAIIGFTKSLYKELSDSSIDVICFALGIVDTDMIKNLDSSEIEQIKKTLSDNKIMTKKFVANEIVDIVLNKKYKNGDIIEINNGLK